MGYQITFRPPKEFVDNELKSQAWKINDADLIRDLRIEMLTFCMNPSDKNLSTDINKLNYQLRRLYNIVRSKAFDHAVNLFESDGEIWYCGWNYSHDECDWDLEDAISIYLESFIILKELVNTPDWFDEHEKFYEKLNEIKSNINGFEEVCEEIVIYEIMNKLRKFDVSNEPEVSDESDEVSDESDEVSDESDEVSDKVSDKVSDEARKKSGML